MHKTDKIEMEKRIRVVQEWIIEDWPSQDIVAQCVNKWGVTERQGFRYLKDARKKWVTQENAVIDHKRKLKIESLKKLKRSLKVEYTGTPKGIRAIIAVEKEIISLEGLTPSIKLEVSGKDGAPIQHDTVHKVVFENYAQ